MPTPRVTVIIPTYNWSTVLPFAIGISAASSRAMAEEMPEEMQIHKLIQTFTTQIAKRTTARFKRAVSAGSTNIDRHKRFKGL